jgi:hypothetical protein
MVGFLLSLPFALLVAFYAWVMVSVHGLVQGLHVTALAVSFFVIATPLPSYLFVFRLLPGQGSGGKNLGIFVFWGACLLLNLATMSYFPKLYANWPITKVSLETLRTPITRNATVTISGVSLLYHWFVSRMKSRLFKAWFHTIGIVVSGLMFYWIIPSIRDVLIVVFNSGNENF